MSSRVAHPYTAWEDYRAGMYDRSRGGADDVDSAFELLTDPEAFAAAAAAMLAEWTTAAEHWLTRPGAKSHSWIGAATCMHAERVPEHCVRKAWWLLTEDQKAAANDVADRARTAWLAQRRGSADA